MKRSRSIVHRIARWLIILLVLPCGFLLLLEGATRLLGPEDLFPQTYDPLLLDARGGRFPHLNRAGFTGLARGRRVRINAHHLRGPEIAPGARPRILLLGDSVLFAAGLEYEQTPAPVLEGLLGGAYAVLNASCIGWSSEHQLAFLTEFGDDLNPAMVILGYCLNDPMRAEEPAFFGDEAARSRWNRALVRANLILRKHSLFFVWLKGMLGVETREHGYSAYIEPLFRKEPWEHNRRVLRRIHDWCRTREIPFLLVLFPHREQLEYAAAASRPQELLAGLGAEAGFPVIDLRPVLGGGDFVYGDPIHLDRGGIRKAMERVAEEIRRARAPEDRLH